MGTYTDQLVVYESGKIKKTASGDTIEITGNLTVNDGAYNLNIASHDGTNGLSLAGTVVTASAAEINAACDASSRTAAEITSSADHFLFLDGSATGDIKVESIDDLLTAIAGTGISNSGSQLVVNASQTQITAVGTIGTGTWQGTAIESAYLDADTAHLSVAQTFSGAKSFSATAKFGTEAGSGQDVYLYTEGTAAHVGIQWDADGETEGVLLGGVDDHGVDFKFFGESSGKFVHWDMSNDGLILGSTSRLYFHDAGAEFIRAESDGHLEINAGTTLDMTAPTIDLNASTAVTVDTDTLTVSSSNANDPVVVIKNTTNDTNGARLKFLKDKGAAGAQGDDAGIIGFFADNAAQEETEFARITAEVQTATDSQEGGKLSLSVAEHDGTMTAGLVLTEGSSDGVIDVSIGAGASSTTTIAGNLTVNGTTTSINSTTLTVNDLNIVLADGAADAAAANGAGIEIDGANATIIYASATSDFDINQNVDISSGKSFKINGTTVLSASGLTIGNAALNEADLEKLDDITNGTAAANKAVVLDGSKNIATIGTVGCGAITSTGNSSFEQITVDSIVANDKSITMTGSSGDTATITVGTNGTLDITTTDTAAAAANIQITADGTAELAGTTVTLDSSGGITLDADGGTITFSDGGSSLGTITSSGWSGTASLATNVTVTANNSTDETVYLTFVDGATGEQGIETDTGLSYNPNSGALTATSFTGAVNGTVTTSSLTSTGNVTLTAANATAVGSATNTVKLVVGTGSGNTIAEIKNDRVDINKHLVLNSGAGVSLPTSDTHAAISIGDILAFETGSSTNGVDLADNESEISSENGGNSSFTSLSVPIGVALEADSSANSSSNILVNTVHGSIATVNLDSSSNVTVGQYLYLHTTPGKATTTVPTAGLVWRLGIVSTAATGTSTANIIWQPQYIISIE